MFVRSLIHLMWLKAVTCARSVQVILIGDLTEVGRTRPERTMSGVARGPAESSVPGGRLVVEGESGRNEFLRGPFALFEAHSRAKFEKTSLSTDGLPCPLQN